ncbi:MULTISPECIES: preprotein translocase subunit YajC [unclassified Modicisalibacter]|uniref:preprotein translocase subunit YajC n=1 Tax=unclassified Modicisalibacter TaxID=2679913 RepID=UPI001CCEA730|nr:MULTISPECIES: preprotein translocase subunit YajC [unclassified Modicisalibacter]MBZ9560478.1 preprotein translocase subunit YajC [Modicisalibacter sp. R2A 31.J]MBZ9575118.1 preprotein translocase subunit YajC [Modicisalibacter sp. MOD 31.J]
MSMTFWLVLAFTILAILSPVLWLRPSPRDRRLIDLRRAAREAGVSVDFGKAPLHESSGLVAYRWRYPQTRPGPRFVAVRDAHASEALKPCAHGWRWRIEPLRPMDESARHAFEAVLAALPGDALVLESTRDQLWVWWRESWNATQFAHHEPAIAGLRDALEGDAPRCGGPAPPP